MNCPVKVDQIWEDRDRRECGRRFKITHVSKFLKKVVTRNVVTGKDSVVSLHRFVPKRYRLVSE